MPKDDPTQSDTRFLIAVDIAVLDVLDAKPGKRDEETIERAASAVWDSLTWYGRLVLYRKISQLGFTNRQEKQAFIRYVFEDLMPAESAPSYSPRRIGPVDKRVFDQQHQPYFLYIPSFHRKPRHEGYRRY